jgi:mannose/cellobiose epimerase-like protein (N-acyl-D-glucosamine 2-epimerase family)
MYTFDSSQSYVPILRYLYGFPLDVEIEGMEIMTIKGLCDAAKAFEIEDLRTYTLKKMEERLVEEVHDVCSCPEDGPPRDTNPELNSFVYDVEALLETNERDSDTDELSDVMVVAVKVCCKYFAVIRQI